MRAGTHTAYNILQLCLEWILLYFKMDDALKSNPFVLLEKVVPPATIKTQMSRNLCKKWSLSLARYQLFPFLLS